MNLEKAIEVLNHILVEPHPKWHPDNFDATKLGIEALKRHQALSKLYPTFNEPPLPSETKE